MQVDNSNTLKILTAKNNILMQNLLKEADTNSLSSGEKLDAKNLLKSLFNSALDGKTANSTLLNTLTNSTLFKSFENISSLLMNLSKNIDSSNNPKLQELKPLLESFMNSSKTINETNIKEFIANSGTMLEAKLNSPNAQNINFNNDLKAILLKMKEILKDTGSESETFKSVDKILTQIDYYQLLSYTSTSNWVYVPFLWNDLHNGSIKIEKGDNENSYCEIDLELKDYDKVKIQIFLYNEESLNISVSVKNQEFKEILQENLPTLRAMINSIKVDSTISIKELVDKTKVSSAYEEFAINYGIDIKA